MSVLNWKIRRELRATYEQALAFFIWLAFPLIRLQKRLFRLTEPSCLEGQRPLGERVVLYLIFSDSDDLSDRLYALDYFLSQSASVICVINGAVSPQWLDQFAQRCAYVLTRQNKGYDFGGYQEGALFLNKLGHSFDHLHIINDSVFMPVLKNETIFRDIESAANTGFGAPVAMHIKKTAIKDSIPAQPVQLALSYWLYFSGTLARSACFKSYWSSYVATSSKVLTVRYGERGLSRYMAAQGYPSTALHTVESVSTVLQSLAPEVLVRILQYASFTDENFTARCEELLSTDVYSPEWSESARRFIRDVVSRRNFLHSFCYLAYGVLQIPFIKKTRMRLPYFMRKQYISAVEAHHVVRPPQGIWSRLLLISR